MSQLLTRTIAEKECSPQASASVFCISHRATLQQLREDRGSSLIEVALILPVSFLFTFGLINFALVMFGICNVAYATRYADRYACLHSDASNPSTVVLASATQSATSTAVNAIMSQYVYPYPANTYTTTITYSGAGSYVGNTATVSTVITYNLVMPLFRYSGPTMTFTASGTIVQ